MALAVDSARWILKDIILTLRRTEELLSLVGIAYLGKVTLSALWDIMVGLRAHVWPKLFPRDFVEEYGRWAVVAGADDKLGQGYAAVLAEKHMNVVLISITQRDLQETAQEIRKKYGAEVEVISVDLCAGHLVYDDIKRGLAGKDVGILVNNIPVRNFDQVTIEEAPWRDLWQLVSVSIGSVPAITDLVLSGMVARQKGAIINICSATRIYNLSMFHIYTAAKLFIANYAQAMRCMYQSQGITVQTVLPSEVSLSMAKYTGFSIPFGIYRSVTPHPSKFAGHALSTLGYAHNTSGYWIFGILAWVMEPSPCWLVAGLLMLCPCHSQ